MTVTIRMDMHCHSSASRAPVVPWLGVLDVPESYSPPERVYDQARARGMDLVTITDHDTVAGAMTLVERGFQGVVVGEEVTVHFPEDRCRLHVLVWGLTPAQHEEIGVLRLREDVYAFAHWLYTHNLAHALAHPVYSQNGRLTPWHLERCVLLFKAWESLNGAHSGTHRFAVERYLSRLTVSRVQAMQRRHAMRALWMRPWDKAVTAGSDDHALLNIGRTWTAVPTDGTESRGPLAPADFLKHVMAGRATVGGETGDSARLAHQVMAVSAQHYARTLSNRGSAKARAVGAAVARFAGADLPAPSNTSLLIEAAKARITRSKPGVFAPIADELARALPGVLEKHPTIAASLEPASLTNAPAFSRHKDMAAFIDDLAAALTASCAQGLMQAVQDKDTAATARALLTGVLATAAQLPTVYALFHQNKERDLLTRLEHDDHAKRSPSGGPTPGVAHGSHPFRPLRVSLFTDTLGDVNGVSRFIQNIADRALDTGRDLQVITSTAMPVPARPNIFNFEPVFHRKMPGYDTLDIVLPPLLKMLRHLDEHQADVVHVSTPGPVGLVGLLAARMLRVPVIGVYHTDFPAYIDRLFDDFTFTSACEWAMRLFYGGFRTIFTRSADYEASLVKLGIDAERIVRLMPGLEVSKFNPTFHDPGLWRRLESESPAFAGLSRESVKVLYVGRVSVEKNTAWLTRVWKRVHERCVRAGTPADLVVVGDGPGRAEMQRELYAMHAHFLGFRHGEELSRLYATSHLFVFPSVTDTLGQVVMESQASGLPVIVTDQGGPKEVVRDGVTGHVLSVRDAGSEEKWVNAIAGLIADNDRRSEMSHAAAESMRGHDIAHSFEHFWSLHEQARAEHMARLGISMPAHRPPTPRTADAGMPRKPNSESPQRDAAMLFETH